MATDNKNLVYPWDDEKFTGSKADKLSVYENLRKLKYPINLYKEVPDKKDLYDVGRVGQEFRYS